MYVGIGAGICVQNQRSPFGQRKNVIYNFFLLHYRQLRRYVTLSFYFTICRLLENISELALRFQTKLEEPFASHEVGEDRHEPVHHLHPVLHTCFLRHHIEGANQRLLSLYILHQLRRQFLHLLVRR